MNLGLLKRKLKQTGITAHDQHDLLALAQLSHAALANAIHLWEQNAPDDMKGMLTGEQGWHWDRTIQKYRHETGRIVDDYELKELAEAVAAALKKKNHALLLLLLAGSLPVLSWRSQMASELTAFYLLMGAMASGGTDRITPATKKIIAGRPNVPPGLLYTIDRLKEFSRKLEEAQEQTAPAIGALEQRMGMYVDATRTIFEEVRKRSHEDEAKKQGKILLARNMLGPAEEHCKTSEGSLVGCLNLTARGWQPAEQMPSPGMRKCRTGCLCKLSFRMVES